MDSAQNDDQLKERVAMRILVASAGWHEDSRVVVMTPRRAQRAEKAAEEIRKVMGEYVFSGEHIETQEVQVAALGFLIRELLRDNEKDK